MADAPATGPGRFDQFDSSYEVALARGVSATGARDQPGALRKRLVPARFILPRSLRMFRGAEPLFEPHSTWCTMPSALPEALTRDVCMPEASHSAVGLLHDSFVLGRRASVLVDWFAQLMPVGARVLDVGCGDGRIAGRIAARRPDLTVEGVDLQVREHTHVPVTQSDGSRLPFEDNAFDLILLSDVLHHTDDPNTLQIEARRVARRHVLIKDHTVKGIAARRRLRFMDRVGNERFGISLPYNYWREEQWKASWSTLGLQPEKIITKLGLYPWPADMVFGARLHFIALLAKAAPAP